MQACISALHLADAVLRGPSLCTSTTFLPALFSLPSPPFLAAPDPESAAAAAAAGTSAATGTASAAFASASAAFAAASAASRASSAAFAAAQPGNEGGLTQRLELVRHEQHAVAYQGGQRADPHRRNLPLELARLLFDLPRAHLRQAQGRPQSGLRPGLG